MKLFAIRDKAQADQAALGYLIYDEFAKAFYIELPDGIDPWMLPPVLSAFAQRGDPHVDSVWSRKWVQMRIVPQDRQNIGAILRDNGLAEYDEFALLMLHMGRCEQDDCYLEELSEEQLPDPIRQRWQEHVTDLLPLNMPNLLVFFNDGSAKVVDIQDAATADCYPYLHMQDRFNRVEVQPSGYGVCWNEQAAIPYHRLYDAGITLPISQQDFNRYLQQRIVSTAEACALLNCSRQNIDDLTRRDRLHPIRTDAKSRFFSKAEVMQRYKA